MRPAGDFSYVQLSNSRVSDDPYMSATGIYDVHRIANDEKFVPRSWVNEEGTYVTKDFVDYVKPLIQGDYQPIMVNGLPRHLVLNNHGLSD